MNFFERQRQVKRLSFRLVALFALAVIGIVLLVDVIVIFAFDLTGASPPNIAGTLITTSVITAAVIGLASLFRTASLRGGGGKVALELGGVYVPEDTTDLQLRRLRNVVEEVAIASGVPVPEVYVLEHEHAINAFAAGWSQADAAIAVTRGALDRLNRDELQGVIAHEFSHVINGDMRLNIKLIGLLFGILFLAIIGQTFMRAGILGGGRSRDSRDSGNALPLIGLALIAAGYLGVFIGRIIKASVSRQREYLADASAVQFTRQTAGLTGALKKIGGLTGGSKLESARTEEVGHMLFGPGLSSMFATHPPLVKRIQVLDPTFDPAQLQALAQDWATHPPSGMEEDLALGLAPRSLPVPNAASTLVDRVAAPTETSYRMAESVIAGIPNSVLDRARRADTVAPLVFGLLVAADPSARASQHTILATHNGSVVADQSLREADELANLDPMHRLPLAELAFPVLKLRQPEEQGRVINTVNAMVYADGKLSTFEYCFCRLLHRELYESAHYRPPWKQRHGSASERQQATTMLLSLLAAAGDADPQAAFSAARPGISYAPPAEGPIALEPLWPVLDALSSKEKEQLVNDMSTVVSHDGVTTVDEMELVRTICAVLRVPLPLHSVEGA